MPSDDRTRDLWHRLLLRVQEHSNQALIGLLADAVPLRCDDNRLVVGVPSEFYADRLRGHEGLHRCLGELDPTLALSIELSTEAANAPPQPARAPAEPRQLEMLPTEARAPKPPRPDTVPPEFQLNPRYTFDAFVVGESNRLAVAAARTVAERPGTAYNPLFVFGPVGLGKTHLIQAVAHLMLVQDRTRQIRYLTTEKFINDVVYGIREMKTHELRQTYRACDVLLIDDIQFLSGKEACQAEFFHTFNALHSAGRQVVVTSDKLPHEIPDLEERVRSRFIWGLIVDLQPPELETRIAIVRKKAEVDGVNLLDDVALFIAQSVRSNVRELEGYLIRATAYAQLLNRPLDMETAKAVLRDVLPARGQLSVEGIIKTVAQHFDVKVSDLRGAKRSRSVATPRQVAMYLCRKHTGASYPDIGKAFGGKDHTTAINAFRRIGERMELEPELRRHVETVEARLTE